MIFLSNATKVRKRERKGEINHKAIMKQFTLLCMFSLLQEEDIHERTSIKELQNSWRNGHAMYGKVTQPTGQYKSKNEVVWTST